MTTLSLLSSPKEEENFPTYLDAIECAKLCQIAYFRHEVPSIESELFKIADTSKLTPHFATRNKYNTDVFIATSDEYRYIVVAFGGTESLRDLCTDFCCTPSNFGPRDCFLSKFGPHGLTEKIWHGWQGGDTHVKVHHGFNRALFGEDLHIQILDALNAVMQVYPSYRLFLTGHSLGAAMAILCGSFLAELLPNSEKINVFAYGAPRVGNQAFRQWVHSFDNLIIWRFVFEADMVPRVPMLTGIYWHVGHLIQCETGQPPKAYYQQIGDAGKGFAGLPKLTAWEARPFLHLCGLLHYHLVPAYLTYLESQLKEQDYPSSLIATSFEKELSEKDVCSRAADEKKVFVVTTY